MPLAPHAKLIQQVIDERNISNLAKENEYRQLEVYRLANCKVKEQIENHLLRDIPYETVKDAEEFLNEIAMSLVKFSMRDLDELFKIRSEILPRVERAQLSANQAIKIYEKERKKRKKGEVLKEDLPQAYDNCVIRFRRLILEIHELWREE